MEAVEESQVVLISGAGLEDFMDDVLSHAKTVVDCSKGIDLLENSEGTDPHIWLDPARAQQMVDNLTAGLTAVYPEHEAAFAENATVLKARLQGAGRGGQKSPLGHFLPGAHHLPRRLRLPGQPL